MFGIAKPQNSPLVQTLWYNVHAGREHFGVLLTGPRRHRWCLALPNHKTPRWFRLCGTTFTQGVNISEFCSPAPEGMGGVWQCQTAKLPVGFYGTMLIAEQEQQDFPPWFGIPGTHENRLEPADFIAVKIYGGAAGDISRIGSYRSSQNVTHLVQA